MLAKLIERAEHKAGSQKNLARMFNVVYSRFGDYKKGRRMPNDEVILRLADYVGLDKAETLYKVKVELEPENAHLWEFLVRSAGLEPTPQASETCTLSS